MGRAARDGTIAVANKRWSTPMPQPNDLSRSLVALDQDSTLIAVIEMSQASWLVGAIVPGVEWHPLKKLAPDEGELLRVLLRWRDEATRAGRSITRIAVAFQAGGTASGWRVGCGRTASRPMSSMRRAWRSRASTGGPKPTGWMSSC
jgi:hypothetical protein